MSRAALVITLLLGAAASGCLGEPEDFDKPTDIAFARSGDFFVSDGYGNSRVVKFSADGSFLLEWGSKGAGHGQLHTPHGITTDGDDRVYVADRGNSRVQIFDSDGRYLTEWRGERVGRPWAVSFDGDRHIYVVDGGDQDETAPRGRVLKIDLRGNIVEAWSAYGLGPGQIADGHDVAVGHDGSVYVVDIKGKRVQKFRQKPAGGGAAP
jgi:DNA-binding beta-propeller fold protein YncE